MPLQITLGELLHQLAHEHMHRPAITMAESGETISYIQFERLVNRVAHGFQSLPHAGNGYVGIMHENAISYLAMAYALKKLNRVEVSINRAFRGAALTRMINLTECQLLMTSQQHLDALAEVVDDLPHLRALILTSGHNAAKRRFPHLKIIDFEQMQSSDESHITSTAHDTDLATIMFTSGTTGVSKGCRLSHRYAVRTAENMIKPFRLTAEDVNYTPLPSVACRACLLRYSAKSDDWRAGGAARSFQPDLLLARSHTPRGNLVHVPWLGTAAVIRRTSVPA